MSLFIGGFIGQLLGGVLNDRLHRYKLSIIISLCGSTTAVGLFFYISTLSNLAADIVIAAVIGFLMKGKDFSVHLIELGARCLDRNLFQIGYLSLEILFLRNISNHIQLLWRIGLS